MTAPIFLTDAELRAVVHELGYNVTLCDTATTVNRVVAAINTVRARPRSEASR